MFFYNLSKRLRSFSHIQMELDILSIDEYKVLAFIGVGGQAKYFLPYLVSICAKKVWNFTQRSCSISEHSKHNLSQNNPNFLSFYPMRTLSIWFSRIPKPLLGTLMASKLKNQWLSSNTPGMANFMSTFLSARHSRPKCAGLFLSICSMECNTWIGWASRTVISNPKIYCLTKSSCLSFRISGCRLTVRERIKIISWRPRLGLKDSRHLKLIRGPMLDRPQTYFHLEFCYLCCTVEPHLSSQQRHPIMFISISYTKTTKNSGKHKRRANLKDFFQQVSKN